MHIIVQYSIAQHSMRGRIPGLYQVKGRIPTLHQVECVIVRWYSTLAVLMWGPPVGIFVSVRSILGGFCFPVWCGFV